MDTNVCVSVDALNSVIKALRCYRGNISNIAADVIEGLDILCRKCEQEIEVKQREMDKKELQIKENKDKLKTHIYYMQEKKSRLEGIKSTRMNMISEIESLRSRLGLSIVSEEERARIKEEIRILETRITALDKESEEVCLTITNLLYEIDKCKEQIKQIENERDFIKDKLLQMKEVLNKYMSYALEYESAIKRCVTNTCEITRNAEKGVIGCRECILKYENVKLY